MVEFDQSVVYYILFKILQFALYKKRAAYFYPLLIMTPPVLVYVWYIVLFKHFKLAYKVDYARVASDSNIYPRSSWDYQNQTKFHKSHMHRGVCM